MLKGIISAALLVAASPLVADTLHLKNGRTYNGTFLGGTTREVRFAVEGGQTQRFGVNDIQRLSFGSSTASYSTAPNESTRARTGSSDVPNGTVVTVRMIDSVNSDASNVGDTYRASLDEPLTVDGRVIAERGADAAVKIVRVQQSGAITGNEEIALVLSEIRSNGRTIPVNTAHAVVSSKSRANESAKVIGGTAIVGAIIGAIAGGGKGAAIGAASGAGAGAAIQAIRGQKVQVPSESKLDFTITDVPLQ